LLCDATITRHNTYDRNNACTQTCEELSKISLSSPRCGFVSFLNSSTPQSCWGICRYECYKRNNTGALSSSCFITSSHSGYQTNSSFRNKQHVVYTTLCCWFASARVSWKPSGFACVGTGCVSVVPSAVDSATLPSSTGFSATGLATPSRVRACVDFGPYASICASECQSK
jgi:hypothetical protein